VRVAPQAAGFEEIGDLTSRHKTSNCYRETIVGLDAKRLWKPGQSFILAEFTLSLPRSAPCRTEQTTIATGCDPVLPRNCVDHPNRLQPLQNNNIIKFAIIRPQLYTTIRIYEAVEECPTRQPVQQVFFGVPAP